MISEGTRQLDLYDFFSILIPGAIFIIGLFPFLPRETPLFSTGTLIATLILGFVAGRTIHAATLLVNGYLTYPTSHRDTFVNQLLDPNTITTELADSFWEKATDAFGSLDLPDDRGDLSRESHTGCLKDLYGLVRGYIHMDARGRSRTFQAVFDFYQCMLTTCVLLFIIYSCYTVLLALYFPTEEWGGYESYIYSLDLWPPIVFFGAGLIFLVPFTTFRKVRSSYRKFYIQYLISDFIVLRQDPDN